MPVHARYLHQSDYSYLTRNACPLKSNEVGGTITAGTNKQTQLFFLSVAKLIYFFCELVREHVYRFCGKSYILTELLKRPINQLRFPDKSLISRGAVFNVKTHPGAIQIWWRFTPQRICSSCTWCLSSEATTKGQLRRIL